MAGYYPSNCDTSIPDHNCDPCEENEYGRVRSFGFIDKDFTFTNDDPTVAADWLTGMQNKNILVVPQSAGEVATPSPLTGNGYGETVEQLLGYDFVATVQDPNFASNCDFYNALIGKRNFKFFYRTSTKTYITPVTVTIIPMTTVPDDLTGKIVWSAEIRWRASVFPCPFNTPEGVFEECFIPNV